MKTLNKRMEEEQLEFERHIPIQTQPDVTVVEPPPPTTTTTASPPGVERRKRVLSSFRVSDSTPLPQTRTPDVAIQLGIVVHRPYSIWEWNGPTDRMQVTLLFVPHRTSIESLTACISAAANRFHLVPEKYCFSDMFDIMYESSIFTHSHEIADPRVSTEVLVFYVPRVYFGSLKQQRMSLYDIVTHLTSVCVKRSSASSVGASLCDARMTS